MTIEEKIKAFPAYSMTRVTGWFVRKDSMNPGKVSEFKDRVNYVMSKEFTNGKDLIEDALKEDDICKE